MSFAQSVKQEILQAALDPFETAAFLSALFAINGHYDGEKLHVKSVSLGLIRRVVALIKETYHIDLHLTHETSPKLGQMKYHTLHIEKPDALIHELGLFEGMAYADHIDDVLIQRKEAKVAYLKGAFLASGSVNAPTSSSYHLEISTHTASLSEDLTALFNELGIHAKYIKRRATLHVTYIKESEKIADFLRMIGTMQALFTFEDERIKRDFYNSITRVMNIELANQNKTILAADKQLKYIAILENIGDVEDLPTGLQEAIYLRKKYPDLSLLELAIKAEDDLHTKISKSGLNHRFRQLESIASQVMEDYHASATRR